MAGSYGYNYSLTELQKYVGKVFVSGFNEISVELLLGGEGGPPFFMCKWIWSDQVYCCDPMEVLMHFDDNYNSLDDIEQD